MNNIKELRKESKLKLIIMSLSLILPILVVIIMYIIDFSFITNSVFSSLPFVPGVICGIFALYIIAKIIKYMRILKDDEYANKVVIIKNDERSKFIVTNANNLASKIFIYVMGVFLIVAAFFWQSIFYTAIGIFIFFIVVRLIVLIYYRKKY